MATVVSVELFVFRPQASTKNSGRCTQHNDIGTRESDGSVRRQSDRLSAVSPTRPPYTRFDDKTRRAGDKHDVPRSSLARRLNTPVAVNHTRPYHVSGRTPSQRPIMVVHAAGNNHQSSRTTAATGCVPQRLNGSSIHIMVIGRSATELLT